MISVCHGGQALLNCEETFGFFLHWDISVLYLAGTITQQRIVPSQAGLLSPGFRIGFIEFNITRTSIIYESRLISQLLISNVTTDTIVYCSQDGDKTNAPMIVINVTNKGICLSKCMTLYRLDLSSYYVL